MSIQLPDLKELSLYGFQIHFDRSYGIDNRTGWSVAIDGKFYSEFEEDMDIAIGQAIINLKRDEDEISVKNTD